MDVKDNDFGFRRIVLDANPASALSALTLLLGGLAVIRGKRFAKPPSA
jgi:hypothetical protein